ncbi:hypothetical protein AN391_03546 [Pseudoalteromonas sp. P1-13-1a]|uniref:ORC-CDC6 family AAA ATPase n=1 Tax=Pseudoalteromonas sp. P1-13-1a TaxID=1723756 RepID=UPI0006D67DC6|nr:hypothetical protein [Pseudoalteromonas sp. P1-13-1a]KPZ52841.1 hypothetical protein AN391_03546 [Pseudoalteromonas sp. P1-13-1a]
MFDKVEQGKKVTSILATNRTENIGMDVWDAFVVPRYFDHHDFFSTMPCKIEGGRGCGKTMLLRYLSYQSQFSPKRTFSDEVDLSHIGLYWRADTQFLRQLSKRGVSSEDWSKCFIHYFVLKVTIEVFKSIDFIAKSKNMLSDFSSKRIVELELYDETLTGPVSEIKVALERIRKKFELAISNPSLLEKVVFFPFDFLKSALDELQVILPELSKTNFHVFIDEYENLLKYQQVIVNTCVKHSEPPIIFKIACKKNGMPFIETTGEEAIVLKNDYIVHDLDEYTSKEYNIFASEVLLSRLSKVAEQQSNICLSNADSLRARREEEYKKSILIRAREIFPGKKQSELAEDVFNKASLRGKLNDMLVQALKNKGCDSLCAKDFIKTEAKEASIVCTALLNRESIDPEALLIQLIKHVEKEKSQFDDWIGTNFVGCYLNIIQRRKEENRLYCGFDTFISLSQGNLRHFLELCRTAFSAGFTIQNSNFSISQDYQSFAANQTSSSLFSEIKSFKPKGEKLQNFANRLGELFALHQSRLSQSEPEKSHFSITGGATSLSNEERLLLDECEKWGVLTKVTATKTKSRLSIDDYDWILNPIYAPKFEISYRKKRKLNLNSEDIKALFSDQKYLYDALYEKHKKLVINKSDSYAKEKGNSLGTKDMFDV